MFSKGKKSKKQLLQENVQINEENARLRRQLNTIEYNRGHTLNEIETEETQPILDQPGSHQAEVIYIDQTINTVQVQHVAHTGYLQIIHQQSPPPPRLTAVNKNWIIDTIRKAIVTYLTRGILGILFSFFFYILSKYFQ